MWLQRATGPVDGINMYPICNAVAYSACIKDVGSHGCPEDKRSNSAFKKSRCGEGGRCG